MVIEDPYEQWLEVEEGQGSREILTLMSGRVQGHDQWIPVVFVGEYPESRQFLTAYFKRQLTKRYGGRPWSSGLQSPNQ